MYDTLTTAVLWDESLRSPTVLRLPWSWTHEGPQLDSHSHVHKAASVFPEKANYCNFTNAAFNEFSSALTLHNINIRLRRRPNGTQNTNVISKDI